MSAAASASASATAAAMQLIRGSSEKWMDGTKLIVSSMLEMAEQTVDDQDETPHTSQFVELDGVPTDDWPTPKRQIAEFLKLDSVELVSNLLVVFNGVAVVAETDAAAHGPQHVPLWILAVNLFLLAIYCLEIALRIYISGARFFNHGLAVADLAIILVDVVLEGFNLWALSNTPTPSLVLLRIFRILRLRRSFRLMVTFPELRVMIHGFTGAAKAIFWGATLIWTALLLWSIILVQVVHPYNVEIAETGFYEDSGCGRCARAYSSVGAALITLTQHILAGDSWGQIAIPVIEYKPWTAPIFIGAILSINLALLNLILAVIVDKAHSAREDDVNHKAYIKRKEKRLAVDKITRVCKSMDADESGTITLEELLQGYENNREFSAMLSVMDVKKEDIHTVFQIVDEHCAGEVYYEEFVHSLYKMKTSETHMLLMFVKHYVTEIQKKLAYEISLVRQLVSACNLSARSDTVEHATDSTVQTANWVSSGAKASIAPAPSVCISMGSEESKQVEKSVQSSITPAHAVRISVGGDSETQFDDKEFVDHLRMHHEDVASTVQDHATYVQSITSSVRVSSSTRLSTSSNVPVGHSSSGSADWNDTSLRTSGQASAAHPVEWTPKQSRWSSVVQGHTLWPTPCCSFTKAAPLPTPGTMPGVARDECRS